MKKIIVVGSTGSIGKQALEVVRDSPDLEIVGLATGSNWQLLAEQATVYGVSALAVVGTEGANALAARLDKPVSTGSDGLVELIVRSDADLVLNAAVGAAGLGVTVATLGEGKTLALANKESLVVGGELVMELAIATRAEIIPIDSEHSALFQLIKDQPAGTVERLTLTASGGPFRGFSKEDLVSVKIEQALRHPVWQMGDKITVDSATLMNKGLELIEAHCLFAVPYRQIDVVVHPQSVVHALVELNDGALFAHMGVPDMRVPISYAIHYPDRVDCAAPKLNITDVKELNFEPPDLEAFPCLELARSAGEAGGTAPCILNAANEVAVAAFLEGKVKFVDIARIIEEVMTAIDSEPITDFEALIELDHRSRTAAENVVGAVVA